MTDRTAKLLARVIPGTAFKQAAGAGGSIETVNLVMAAMGMGKAGREGTLILLANYCEDENARLWACQWLTRWAWLTWLKVGAPDTNVTTGQMQRLAAMALGQHIDPEAGRKTSLKAMAELVGVNHQTFRKKYRRHFHRMQAEIAYHESQAISALERKMG